MHFAPQTPGKGIASHRGGVVLCGHSCTSGCGSHICMRRMGNTMAGQDWGLGLSPEPAQGWFATEESSGIRKAVFPHPFQITDMLQTAACAYTRSQGLWHLWPWSDHFLACISHRRIGIFQATFMGVWSPLPMATFFWSNKDVFASQQISSLMLTLVKWA